jgi:hypothetical protein
MDGLVGAVGIDERHHELGRLVHDLRAVGLKQREGVDDGLLDQIAVLAIPPQVEFSVSITSTRIVHVVSREYSHASSMMMVSTSSIAWYLIIRKHETCSSVTMCWLNPGNACQ